MHRFHRLFGNMERELLCPLMRLSNPHFCSIRTNAGRKIDVSRGRNVDARTDEVVFRPPTSTKNQVRSTIYSNNENKTLPPSNWPWVQRWAEVSKNADHSNVSYPFMVSTKGVLSLRTLSKMGVCDGHQFHSSGLLAGLISWGLPHASKQGEWLIATQMNWSSAMKTLRTADVPFAVLCSFCEVCLSSSKRHMGAPRSLTRPRNVGHFYEIRISRGAHNAPFKIHGVGKRHTTSFDLYSYWEIPPRHTDW